jgi:hypothetical protein
MELANFLISDKSERNLTKFSNWMRLSEIHSLLLRSFAVRKFSLYLRCKRNSEKDWENKRGKVTATQTRAERERDGKRDWCKELAEPSRFTSQKTSSASLQLWQYWWKWKSNILFASLFIFLRRLFLTDKSVNGTKIFSNNFINKQFFWHLHESWNLN